MKPTGSSPARVTGQADAAAVQEVADGGVAQQQHVLLGEALGRRDLVERRCRDGAGRHHRGVVVGRDRRHALLQVGARLQELDIVGGAHLLAAHDARMDELVVVLAAALDQLAMPGIGLRGREPAPGVDRVQLVQLRQVDRLDLHADARQRLQRPLEGRGDDGIEIVHHEMHGTAKRRPASGARRGNGDRLAGEHRIDDGAAFDGVGERADRIERGRQRHHAVDRHAPRRRLEAGDAAHRGGNAHRAAGVGAERRHGHAIGHRDGGARRRTARHPLAIGRIARRAVVRVEAHAREGELAHVGAAHDHRTGGAQARHDRRVFLGRWRVVERLGAGQRRLAGDVAEVLDRERQARERRGDQTRLAQGVAGVGGGQRLVAPDLDEGAFALALGVLDAGERFLGELARGGAAGGQVRRELLDCRVHFGRFTGCGSSRGRRPPPDRPASTCRRDCSISFSAILRRMRRMILPERVLGRPGAHWITSGVAIGADLLAHPGDQFLAQFFGRLHAGLERHVGVDALALDVVRDSRPRRLRRPSVADQGAFDFGGADAMAGDVDHVVDAAGDPVVAVGIAAAAVAGEVLAGIGA